MTRFVMSRRENAFVRRMARFCDTALKAFENLDHDFRRNGEIPVLERLAAAELSGTILDVGANIGEYAMLLARHFPSARIYAFEIVPDTFSGLSSAVKSLSRVTPVNIGLSDRAGTARIKFYKELSALSTMTDFPHDADFEWLDVQTTTGAEFCRQHRIDEIDFLKVDVEGHESEVLHGFGELLTSRRIKVIQFEYGYANVLTKFLLKDYYDLFSSLGYAIGKIYPGRVEFKKYEVTDENFWGPNYVAVRNDLPDVIRLLSA